MTQTISAILVVFMLFSTSVLATDEPAKLDEHGRILLPVLIPNKPLSYFLFDSAARRGMMRYSDMRNVAVREYAGSTLRYFDSSGLDSVAVANVTEMTVLGYRSEDKIFGFVTDEASAAGQVGYDAFPGMILHWQPEEGAKYYANAGPVAGEGWGLMTGRENSQYNILMQTTYKGIEIDVVAATGSSRTLIDSALAAKLFEDFSGSVHQHVNANDHLTEVWVSMKRNAQYLPTRTLKNFKLGEFYEGDLEVVIKDINVQEITGYRDGAVILLGADVLAKREVAFDYRNFQLWFKKDSRETPLLLKTATDD